MTGGKHLLRAVAVLGLLQVAGASMAGEVSGTVAMSSISLTLETDGKPKGSFVAALFTTEESFLTDAVATVKGPVSADGTGALRFEGVEPGLYAISVFHDKDNDGKLDTNFIGIPSEPVGTSNNPKPRMGPPRFEDAKFTLGSDPLELHIKLQ